MNEVFFVKDNEELAGIIKKIPVQFDSRLPDPEKYDGEFIEFCDYQRITQTWKEFKEQVLENPERQSFSVEKVAYKKATIVFFGTRIKVWMRES